MQATLQAGAEDVETLELELLLAAVARRYGYDFRHYARASLRRRLRRAMLVEKVRSLSGLQERLLHDPDALARFVSTLSVNVTGMFRDPAVYRDLRRKVVPMLRTWPFVRVWHAGCSTGEEAYSLAIVLREEGLHERSQIYATDISGDLLERARRGVVPLAAMRDYTVRYHQAGGRGDFSAYYTAAHQRAILAEELRRQVVFSQHNLVSDASFNEFHLILCRNVLIYFDSELRERVHELLLGSLVLFGVLVLGTKESLRHTPFEDRYEAVAEEERIFRRVR